MRNQKKEATTEEFVNERRIVLPPIERRKIAVRLYGSSIIVHRFGVKAIIQMLGKHMGIHVEREVKDPSVCFEDAKYKNTDNVDCIPAMTIKKAMVEASGFTKKKITKKTALGSFYVIGEVIPIKFERCQNRMDVTRNANGQPDIRFRPEYHNWSADVVIDFNPNHISLDQVLYLLREGGASVGLCEWRPQKAGSHGIYDIEPLSDALIPDIEKACKVPAEPMVLPDWVLRHLVDYGGGDASSGLAKLKIESTKDSFATKERKKAAKLNGESKNPDGASNGHVLANG